MVASTFVHGEGGAVPSVSVVVPSYQGADRLVVLLDALAAQIVARDWEVVLVIDGSSDRSHDVAAAFTATLPLRVVARRHNLGRAATLNEGFAVARGDVLVRCDDDLEPGPGAVERFGARIGDDRLLGLVGLCRNELPATAYARAYGVPVDLRFRQEAYAAPGSDGWRFWAGFCGVHRQMWERVGTYDALTFRGYGWEDVDWGYRLVKAGGRIELDPALEVPHHVAATTSAIRVDRAQASGSAARLFDLKHRRPAPPEPSGMWGAAVRSTSRWISPARAARLDGVLDHVPPRAGLHLVDLAVQAAFRAGYRDGAGA